MAWRGGEDGGIATSSDEEEAEEAQVKLTDAMQIFLEAAASFSSGNYRSRDDEAGHKSGYSHSAPRPGRTKNKTDLMLSKWWIDYQRLRVAYEANQTGRQYDTMCNKWRRRFRVPLKTFLLILEICREQGDW